MFKRISYGLIAVLALSSYANAHGDHQSSENQGDEDWATLHMRGEFEFCGVYQSIQG